ncbi:MAG: leucine-rich repeat protein, partial [Bacilli bacterium]|nr:leucine-rich repeat protein [Bacilli bacterium]
EPPTSLTGFQVGDSYIDTTTWKYYVLIKNSSEELVWDYRGTIKGNDGIDGQDGTKFRVGDTAPSETTGYQEGDSYLDTSTWNFYVLTKDGEGNLNWGSAVGNIHNSPNVLTVTFESNGGTAVTSIDDALEGEKITKPADPTKDGYFFEGWYTSEGNKWAFEKDVLTEDITLLARWGQLEVTNGVLTGCSLTGRIDIPYVYNGEVISAISSDVFRGNVNLEAITLPASIKEIPANAFEGCEGLFEVNLPESITSIGERAFSGCENLIIINLPNSITTIGDYAFKQCYSLQAVDLPDWLPAISEGMFCECGGLQHIIFNQDGYDLNSIGSHAFDYCYSLEELIIPNSVTSIAENCFVGDYDEYPDDYELRDLSLPFIGFGENGDKGLIDFFDGSHFPGFLYSVKISGSRPIFEGAFDGCDQIYEVEFTGTPSKFDLNCLRGLTNIEALNLPYLGETNSNPTNKSYLGHLFGATSASGNYSSVPASLYAVQVRGGKVGAKAFTACQVHYVVFGQNVTGFERTGNSSYGGDCETLKNCNNLEYLEVPFVGISANNTNTYYSFLGALFGSSVASSNAGRVPSSLKEITINSAYSLPNEALSYLSSVETINLDPYLTSIGEKAFSSCSHLKNISIPDSVKTIGRDAFQYCSALETVKLPSNPNFTAIASATFYKCNSLKTIVIPDTVTSIGNSAFYECYKLVTADLGDGVISIGAYAFNNCHDLRNVRFGSALQTIGEEAFKFCENLNNIVIPKSVTSIGDSSFYGCSGLTNLSFEYVYNGDPLTIGRWAFERCYALPSVALPDRVQSLGYLAFAECRALTYIYIPNNCSIDDSCFSQDVSLRSISFPYNVTLGNYVLSGCNSITSISLWSIPSGGVANLFGTSNPPTSLKTIHIEGNSMTSIPNGAFKYLRSVTAIDLPLGVNYIGDEAFYDCQSLLHIDLKNVEHIGKYAFYNCYSLATISSFIDEGDIGEYAFQNCHSLVNVTINSSNDLTIGECAFDNCDGLLSVNIFASNTSNLEFGLYAFRNCDGLQTVTISKQDGANIDFGGYTFASCNALTYVRFGNSGSSSSAKDLKTGDNAFRDCPSLKFVENNSKDLVVGNSAFNGCKNLKFFRGSGTSGVGIKSIGNNGFSNCWSLEVIHYNGLTSIGNYAFSACYAFKSISLPDTVTTMGDGIFWGCTYLESCKLPFNDELTTIPSSTFYKCPALKSFNISSNFDTIGSYAFQETGLVSIDIPPTITSIKNGAFSSCHSLKSVKLPENSGYTKIEDSTFYDCTALESIRIPSNVFTLGNNVFRGDTSLKTLTIIINTSKILNVGSDSFRDVELTTINFTGTQTEYEYFTSAPGSNAYTQSGNDTLKNTYPGVTVNYDYVEA